MTEMSNTSFFKRILLNIPVILLFISVLNEFDFNFLKFEYFSFNFNYILIFYFSLIQSRSLGYGLIFIAGLFNDVLLSMPIGISSLIYLLICGFASYLRNITLRPHAIKDWVFFLITISVANSILYILLTLIFSFQIEYLELLINTFFTFLFYPVFSYLFKFYKIVISKKSNG